MRSTRSHTARTPSTTSPSSSPSSLSHPASLRMARASMLFCVCCARIFSKFFSFFIAMCVSTLRGSHWLCRYEQPAHLTRTSRELRTPGSASRTARTLSTIFALRHPIALRIAVAISPGSSLPCISRYSSRYPLHHSSSGGPRIPGRCARALESLEPLIRVSSLTRRMCSFASIATVPAMPFFPPTNCTW